MAFYKKGIKIKRVCKLSGWHQRTKEFYTIQRMSCEKLECRQHIHIDKEFVFIITEKYSL